jgi:hypothetical protein
MKLTNILFFFVERVMLQLADNEVHRAGNPSLLLSNSHNNPWAGFSPKFMVQTCRVFN